MNQPVEALLSLTLLTVLAALGSSRMMGLVKIMAYQGALVALTAILLGEKTGAVLLAGLAALAIKGAVIPYAIYLAMRKISIRREVEPIIGYNISIFAGLGMILFFVATQDYARLPALGRVPLLLPTGLTVTVAGLFLIMARTKAITQVIGYLMMENGVFLIGALLMAKGEFVVEFGVLLDMVVGVMVMGIVVNNIQRTFDDIDSVHLSSLKDWPDD
jgi:hydrogenase-4 component E